MADISFTEVYNAFEATFADKIEIDETLEYQWLKMAVAEWNIELADENITLTIDEDSKNISPAIDQYNIDLLGAMMKEFYQEREFSRVNKIGSIVGKDLSVNSGMSLSKYSKEDLENAKENVAQMLNKLKPTAYS